MALTIDILVLLSLLVFSDTTVAAAKEALIVWGLHVVPSLFPYMVFCKTLASRLRLSRIPPGVFCAMLGLLGGSPSGAAMLSEYAACLSKRSFLSLCVLCGTISPMFFLGTLSSWTGDPLLCGQLLVSQLIGAAVSALCVFSFSGKVSGIPVSSGQADRAQSSPVSQSIDAVLQVGGCIIVYSVMASLLGKLPFLPRPLIPVLHALLEASGGLHAISGFASYSEDLRALLLAFCAAFSGFSILSQNHFFLKPCGIRMTHLAVLSFLRALAAVAVMLLMR